MSEAINIAEKNTVPITLDLPRDLLIESGLSTQAVKAEILRVYVLSLYRQDRISSGKAARLLGMHRLNFIRLLAEEQIPYLEYTSEELETELTTVQIWSNQQ